jgi:mannose/fructose/N-acetylgalactosamine-specific phosphotransferase system component IIB
MVIYRVDDRLIHGQVVETWIPTFNITDVLVISESVYNDELRQSIMRFSTPDEVSIEYLKPADLLSYQFKDDGNYLVLFPSLNEIQELVDSNYKIDRLNLGGIHYSRGRNFSLGKALFLSKEECKILKYLKDKNIYIYAQSIPSEKEIPLEDDI